MRNGIIAVVAVGLFYWIFFTGGGEDPGDGSRTTPGGVPIVGVDSDGPEWGSAGSGPGEASESPVDDGTGGTPVPANVPVDPPARPVPAVGQIETLEDELRGTLSPEKDDLRLRLADAYRENDRAGEADALYRQIYRGGGALAAAAAATLLDRTEGEARTELASFIVQSGAQTPGYGKAALVHGRALAERSEESAQLEGWRLLSDAYFSRPEESWRAEIRPTLVTLSEKWLLSPRPCTIATSHTVERGDYLARIAQDNKVTVGMVQVLNQLDSDMIHPGDRLKMLDRKIDIVVDKSEYRLDVRYDGGFLMSFPVGHGAYGKTPVAKFVVDLRQEKPNWYPTNKPMVAYGEPGNPLGERWLGFAEQEGFKGFGLHGTNQPETIGTEASDGCVRLSNENVMRLYPFVALGCEVEVVE